MLRVKVGGRAAGREAAPAAAETPMVAMLRRPPCTHRSRRAPRALGTRGPRRCTPSPPDAASLAAVAAVVVRRQRLAGDLRPARRLFREAYSFLRYFHHRWAPRAAA